MNVLEGKTGVIMGVKEMFQVGDTVVYGIHGVCKVADLEERVIDRKRLTYLALEPVGQGGSRYFVPTHNETAMAKVRSMLSREDWEALIQSKEVLADGWIKDENQRKQTYRELIAGGDRTKLLQMVHTLYRHKAAQSAAGKKCHLCDENFLRDAERLLISEMSIVMGMEPDQAKQYIRSKLKEDA